MDAFALLTYLRLEGCKLASKHRVHKNVAYTQPSRFFVTISKHRIRSGSVFVSRRFFTVLRIANLPRGTCCALMIPHCVKSQTMQPVGGGRTKQASTSDSSAMHGLSLKVRGERPLAIRPVQEGSVAVRAECTGKYADVAKNALSTIQFDNWSSCSEGKAHTSSGLSKMLEILYYEIFRNEQRPKSEVIYHTSKFCEAARGLVSRTLQPRPVSTQIL